MCAVSFIGRKSNMRILSGLLERALELKETRVSRPQWLVSGMLPPALPIFAHPIACRDWAAARLIKKSGSIGGDRASLLNRFNRFKADRGNRLVAQEARDVEGVGSWIGFGGVRATGDLTDFLRR
jgi:hypothetical protein